VLCPGDEIRVEVAGEPGASCNSRILKSGKASLPFLGSVEIAGLSVKAATAKIRDLYAKDFRKNPKVTLSIRVFAPDFVSVIGAVKNPGQIPIPNGGKLDLATAMAACGGVTEKADPARIQVIRAFGANETYDLAAIKGGAAGRVKLDAGDCIVVNQSSR
jgi:polysaccharide export outer membrane protein